MEAAGIEPRVRGRTGQGIYERSPRLISPGGGSQPTDGPAILKCRAPGDWLSLGAEPDRWRRVPDLGPESGVGVALPS